jgi:hypothetical protein
MIAFVFLITLISGGQTLVGKPTMESCEAIRAAIEQTENVQAVTACVQATIITHKADAKGGS